MSDSEQKERDVERAGELIKEVERKLLVGLDFPSGRSMDGKRDIEERQFSSGRIVDAYNLLRSSGEDRPDLLERIYLLARLLYTGDGYNLFCFRSAQIPDHMMSALKMIADQGRAKGRHGDCVSAHASIAQGRIFVFGNILHAVSLPNPRAGYSASLCSNCFEPVAFCNGKCSNCSLPFIGPFGAPKVDEWQKMGKSEKESIALELFASENHGRMKGSL